MRAGALRHKIVIQEPTETQDSVGGPDATWSTFATVWASIEPLNGRELFAAQQINAEITARIRIRYLSGVIPKMRVSFGERIFEILSVINLEERNREMELMVKEDV